MTDRNLPIGVFDSGVGGLTVLKELKKLLPNETFIYYADLKNSPYGEKSGELIETISREIIEYFIKRDVKMIIIACNTASSYNIENIRKDYQVEIFTVLESAASSILPNKSHIYIAATTATCESGSYKKEILKINPYAKVTCISCPLIVPAIESKSSIKIDFQNIIDGYMAEYKNENISTFILGCTHYPIVEENFRKNLKKDVVIINPASKLSKDVQSFLVKNNIDSKNKIREDEFVVTDNVLKFINNAKKIIPEINFSNVKSI